MIVVEWKILCINMKKWEIHIYSEKLHMSFISILVAHLAVLLPPYLSSLWIKSIWLMLSPTLYCHNWKIINIIVLSNSPSNSIKLRKRFSLVIAHIRESHFPQPQSLLWVIVQLEFYQLIQFIVLRRGIKVENLFSSPIAKNK